MLGTMGTDEHCSQRSGQLEGGRGERGAFVGLIPWVFSCCRWLPILYLLREKL